MIPRDPTFDDQDFEDAMYDDSHIWEIVERQALFDAEDIARFAEEDEQ